MTVATTKNRNDYTASAAQTTFPYEFRIFAGADLKVYVNSTLKTLTTDYTVTGADSASGGNVVFNTGLTAGDAVAIIRSISYTQSTDYVENDPFPAETHEKALDRLTMLTQQLTEVDDRSVKLSISSTMKNIELPLPGSGEFIRWNSAGTNLETVPLSSLPSATYATSLKTLPTITDLRAEDYTVSTRVFVLGHTSSNDGGGGVFMWDAASSATDNSGTIIKPTAISTGNPGRWLRIYSDAVNATWFGATGNGTTNDSAAVQAAIDYVESLTSDGVALVFPPGDYLVSGLTVDARVHLIGNGATIKAAATTGNILSLSATAQMSIIEGFRFDSGSQRTAGDYIKLTGTYWVTIRDCSFWRYYNAIHGDGAVSIGVDNCQFQEPTPSTTAAGGAAIVLDTNNNVDWRLSNLIADCAVGEPTYGIKAAYTDALTIVNCDIINHGSCLALVPGTGQAVAATFVANSYFDNSAAGLDINPSGTGTVTRVSIEGCWFGSNSFHNVYINQTGSTVIEGVSIGGGQNVLSAGNGIATVGTVNGLVVSGGIYSGNTSSGISLSAGTTKCAITGAVIGVGSGSTGNAYGIFLNTSTGDVMIANNVIKGNVTADIGGTAGTARFDNNITGTSSTVASTATLTLPVDKDFFIISGTNNITDITASWAGREVTLMFQAALTVVDGGNLKIAGNFVTSADDTISLVCDGTSWVEKSRAAN